MALFGKKYLLDGKMKAEDLKRYIKKLITEEVKKVIVPTVVRVVKSKIIKEQIGYMVNEQLNDKLMKVILEQKSANLPKNLKQTFSDGPTGDSDIDEFIMKENKRKQAQTQRFKDKIKNLIVDENTQNFYGDLLTEDDPVSSPSMNSFVSEPKTGADGLPIDSDDEGVDISQFGF